MTSHEAQMIRSLEVDFGAEQTDSEVPCRAVDSSVDRPSDRVFNCEGQVRTVG